MAILKCKMCGGALEINPGETIAECAYCGTKQTVPNLDDDRKVQLYERANKLRRANEFDKAFAVYESIIASFPDDAEAYWGELLCKYGIEYVDDPATGKKIPTCHRSSYTCVLDDECFELVMENSDPASMQVYRQEAKQIEEIRKGILDVSSKEEPYDIFICYKETDENGNRTIDSVIAQDVYNALVKEGYRVFFSRISLEDKLGKEYEPYIFAALNSAKVMLVFGTKYEYFNAVWVKNEWSRYLHLITNGDDKTLIPCYRDIDVYDMPKEFARLQSQDLGKIGAIQDIVRGIGKIVPAKAKEPVHPNTASSATAQVYTNNVSALIKRGYIALEDNRWQKADGFFEEALNQDAESAEAYIGKLLAKDRKENFPAWIAAQKNKRLQDNTEQLEACPEDSTHIENIVREFEIDNYLNANEIRLKYQYDRKYNSVLSSRRKQAKELTSDRLLLRAIQYAQGDTKQMIDKGLAEIESACGDWIARAEQEDTANIARIKEEYSKFIQIVDQKVEALHEEALKKRENQYETAVSLMNNTGDLLSYKKAVETLKSMNDYKDSKILAEKCQKEVDRLTEQKLQEEKRVSEAEAKKKKITAGIIGVIVIACIIAAVVMIKVIIPGNKYSKAVAMMENGDYESARAEFQQLGDFKDSSEKYQEIDNKIHYDDAISKMENGDYEAAYNLFNELGDYSDASQNAVICKNEIDYQNASAAYSEGNYEQASALFGTLAENSYKDSAEQLKTVEKAIADFESFVKEYSGNYVAYKRTSASSEEEFSKSKISVSFETYMDPPIIVVKLQGDSIWEAKTYFGDPVRNEKLCNEYTTSFILKSNGQSIEQTIQLRNGEVIIKDYRDRGYTVYYAK